MPRLVVYSLAIMSILIIAGGYVAWTLLKPIETNEVTTPPTPQPTIHPTQMPDSSNIPDENNQVEDYATPTPDPNILLLQQVEQARNNAEMYMVTEHPEVAVLFTGDEWQQLSSSNIGRYDYFAGGWNATVLYVADNPLAITFRYFSDWQVTWQGTDLNGTVTELYFTSNIPK